MSRDASVIIDWVDGPHTFRLGWGELVKLQEACDAGPYVVYQRLMLGQWRMEDIASTIRLGLIGGGMEPGAALKLVQGYVEADRRWRASFWPKAFSAWLFRGRQTKSWGKPRGRRRSAARRPPPR